MKSWQIKTKILTLVLLALCLIVFASCQRNEEEATPVSVLQTASVAAPPTETAVEPTLTPSPAPTATEEPITPALSVTDQLLEDDGQLVVSEVVAANPGWVVVYSDESGTPGDVLGYSAVGEGQNNDILIQIDPLAATETLHLLLHSDLGERGAFDFPGPDNPVNSEAGPLQAMFVVERRTTIPSITVENQEVADDGLVMISSVVSKGAGWLVLFQDQAGEPGQMLGYSPVEPGTNETFSIAINWREATPILYAALYEDSGQTAVFEVPEPDGLVVLNAEPLIVPFEIGLPADVFVLNQPVIDDKIVVERVISRGPGWLVVYRDDEGQTGNIIGFAPLEDGLNEEIEVEILTSEVSTLLHIIIHEDDGTLGEFNFPAGDGPMRFQGQIPANPFDFRTDSGNYMILRGQSLSAANTITISLVVVDVNAWVAVHTTSAENPGEIIGLLWLPAGLHRDVVVEIDPELTTIDMYVVLHLDIGQPQVFDFPDDVDIPLQRNRNFIQVPLILN